MYPGMAKSARDEGFAEIADWFETLAKAEKSHAGRFAQGSSRVSPREPRCPNHHREQPTPGLTYNPNDPVYWDKAALQQELDRVFEICHGCRLCFNLCPTFPELFSAVDKPRRRRPQAHAPEHDRVIDTCYQCKICYVKCPYTPDDGHSFQLDFPRLLLRANADPQKSTRHRPAPRDCSRVPRCSARSAA